MLPMALAADAMTVGSLFSPFGSELPVSLLLWPSLRVGPVPPSSVVLLFEQRWGRSHASFGMRVTNQVSDQYRVLSGEATAT